MKKLSLNARLVTSLFFLGFVNSVGGQVLLNKYETKGHPKAKGLSIAVRYPQNWEAREGERPNIVQRFEGEFGATSGLLILQINAMDGNVENECKGMTAKDWRETFEVPGISIVNPRTIHHENQPGAILEISQSTERAGTLMHGYSRVMAICYKSKLVIAWCGSSEPTSTTKVKNNMSLLSPLCSQYFNSMVFLDKYK